MYQNVQLLIVPIGCEDATARAAQLLSEANLHVMRSFDLRSARAVHAGCTCPHHGTDQCTCQMVVLLVYGPGSAPVTLVAHGQDDQTWLSLVDIPQQPADPQLRSKIAHALVPENFVVVRHGLLSDECQVTNDE